MLDDASILVTGGTGSFGRALVARIVAEHRPRRLIILSRDDFKQYEMAQRFPPERYPFLRYFLGDVRDLERLKEALRGVDYVIHAAAMKQVPAAEYNPFEAVQTNVIGSQNVIRACIERRVKRVVALSSDKAASPVNLYGATKLCADKLFVAGNAMSGDAGTAMAVVRYGNVVGSRGSVIPFFMARRESGVLPITDPRMTRFLITLPQAVAFVLRCLAEMDGGETFVPRLPSARVVDIARAVAPDARLEVVGIRPGEKIHEVMVPEDEAHSTLAFDDHFVIQPPIAWRRRERERIARGGRPCPAGFRYDSGSNDVWLSVEEIRRLVAELEAAPRG